MRVSADERNARDLVDARIKWVLAPLGLPSTLSSFLCGMAPSLGLLLLARVVQGLGGGGFQPMAQAILADTFTPQQRGMAFALYGITAIIAPTIGPTLGGWMTDAYSWRWIFLITLLVGLMSRLLVRRHIEDPPYLSGARRAGCADASCLRGHVR